MQNDNINESELILKLVNKIEKLHRERIEELEQSNQRLWNFIYDLDEYNSQNYQIDIDESGVSEDQEESDDQESRSDKGFNYKSYTQGQKANCPVCDKEMGIRGIPAHIQEHDLTIKSWSKEGDVHKCRECSFEDSNYTEFKRHINEEHTGIIDQFLQFYDPDDHAESDGVKDIVDRAYNNEHRKRNLVEFLEDSEGYKSISEIARDLFDQESISTTERSSLWKSLDELEEEGRVKSTSNGSENIYNIPSAEEIQMQPNYKEQAISKLGKDDWDILTKAFFIDDDQRPALIPESGTVRAINFYDFAAKVGEFNSHEKETVWELLLTNNVISKAIEDYLEEDLEITIKDIGGSGIESKILELSRGYSE